MQQGAAQLSKVQPSSVGCSIAKRVHHCIVAHKDAALIRRLQLQRAQKDEAYTNSSVNGSSGYSLAVRAQASSEGFNSPQ